ncbi:MAG TPA: transglycosylase SLT domain-containing protein, partial [Tepidiformaceae bacterium]|nr:transglycosylase SLT domain-containing protein [Tepidiformaceae bacterium]
LVGGAVAQHENGDAAASVESLRSANSTAPAGSETAWEAAYLLGLRLNERQEHAAAREALRPFTTASTHPLRPFVLVAYAEALAGTGDDAGAAGVWDQVLAEPIPGALKEDIFRARAEAAREDGDDAAEGQWLDALIEATGDPAVRLARALQAREAGDNSTFAGQLQILIARSPSSQVALEALEILLDAKIPVDAGIAGLVYYRQGEYAKAIEVLEAGVATPIDAASLTFRLYYLAAAREALGEYEEAIALYDRAAATGASSPFIHRAKWWAARLIEDVGDPYVASARYLAIVTGGPPGEFTGEAAFRAGYAIYRAGSASDAITTWDVVGATTDTRLLYWRGRAFEEIGSASSARVEYELAVAADPTSFYGMESARLLGAPPHIDTSYLSLGEVPPIDWSALEAWLGLFVEGDPVEPTDTGAAEALVIVGLRDAAEELLLESAGGSDPWSLLARAEQAHDLGLTEVALSLGHQLREATEGGPEAPIDLLRLEYPLSYVALLDRESEENDIDPLLLAALIRQESLWDPSAGSFAGALGLAQVIPPTGEAIAEELGVEDFETRDLFRPSTSIRFGAHYLAGQLRAYRDIYVALSAYNAGPGNAARWQEADPGETPADYLETIDFAETRAYVELVMEHYARYRLAWR